MQKCRSCQVDDERNVEVWCRKKKRETGVTSRDGVCKVLTAKRDAQLATSLLLVIWVSVLVATSWQIWSAHQRTLSAYFGECDRSFRRIVTGGLSGDFSSVSVT